MRLLLGAEQVDVEGEEELPCPCDSGPPAGDKGAGAKVGRPLGLLELWKDSPWSVTLHGRGACWGWGMGKEEGTYPCRVHPKPARPQENTTPFQAGPRTPPPGWPAGSGDWPPVLPLRRGTLQGGPAGQALAGGHSRTPIPRGEPRQAGLASPSSCLSGSALSLWVVTDGHSHGLGRLLCPPGAGQAPPFCSPHTDVPAKAIG